MDDSLICRTEWNFSTCFGKLCAHHQETLPYLCDTWYLSLYVDDCLACRTEWHFSTCCGKLCAHHQEKIPYLCDTWYLSLYMDDSNMQDGMKFLYMFRETMCPSSGDNTVPMRHLVFVTLCGWLSRMQDGMTFLYMLRETMCPSSGENTVPMRHVVFVTLYKWLSGMQGGMKFRPTYQTVIYIEWQIPFFP